MDVNNQNLISIVMSVYNAEEYLKESIESILNQTYSNFEFIIINDGSKDTSLEIIKGYKKKDDRILLIDRGNKGLPYSLNEGIKKAKGKYIARMDADDISLTTRFEEQVDFMENNPNVTVVGSNANILDKNGNYIYTTNQQCNIFKLKKVLPYDTPFIHPTVMFRANSLKKTNLYPLIPIAQDLFLFNILADLGNYANISKPLLNYRITPSSSSRRTSTTQKILTDILIDFLRNEKLSTTKIKDLKNSIKHTSTKIKEANYYLYLAKKYLWNGHNSKKARENILLYIKYEKINMKSLIIYFMTLLPNSLIVFLYKKYK